MEAFHAHGLPPPRSASWPRPWLAQFLSMGGRFIVALSRSVVEICADRFALRLPPAEFPTQISCAITAHRCIGSDNDHSRIQDPRRRGQSAPNAPELAPYP